MPTIHADEGDGTEPFTFSENRIRISHDMGGERELGTTITTAIALLTDRPKETVGAELTRIVDFDALDRLFRPRSDTARTGGHVVFTVDGCSVTVTSTGLVIVERRVD